MDELLHHLKNCQTQEATEYFLAITNDVERCEMFFSILTQDNEIIQNPKLQLSFIGLFKNWISTNWLNLNEEVHGMFYSLIEQMPIIANLGDFISQYISKYTICPRIYDQYIFSIFTALSDPSSLSLKQISSLTTISHSIIRNYHNINENEVLDVNELYQKFLEIMIPLIDNAELQKSEDGAIILDNTLYSFFILFNRVQPDPSQLEPFINLSRSVIELFATDDSPHPLFVSACIRFVNRVFKIELLKEQLSPLKEEFIGIFINALSIYVKKQCDSSFLLESILISIENLKKLIPEDTNILDLFLEASIPSVQDLNDLFQNPSVFYSLAYSTETSEKPLIMLRSLIHHMVSTYDSCLDYLINLPISEVLCRQISHCCKIISSKEGGNDILVQWVNAATVQIADDSFEIDFTNEEMVLCVSSQLFLLVSTVKYFPLDELAAIMEHVVPKFLNDKYSILTIASAKLLYKLIKHDIYPENECIDNLIKSIGTSLSNEPMKTLQKLCEVLPNTIERRAQDVLLAINNYIELDNSEENVEIMSKCLEIIDNMIKYTPSVGHNYVCDYVVRFIDRNLSCDEDTLIDASCKLIQTILTTKSQRIPEIIQIVMKNLQSNQYLYDCIDEVIYIFLRLISKCILESTNFSELNISEEIINLFTHYMFEESNGIESSRSITTLLIWIIMTDNEVNLDYLFGYCNNLLENYGNLKDTQRMCIMQLYATLYISRGILFSDEIVHKICKQIHDEYCIDSQDCIVYALFIMRLIDSGSSADTLMPYVFQTVNHRNKWENLSKEQREEYINDEGFKFSDSFVLLLDTEDITGPFNQYDIMSLVSNSIIKCSVEGLYKLRELFPDNFS